MSSAAPVEFLGDERFIVMSRLGQGGMGVVYQVFDRRLGAVVALKTLLHMDPAAIYRFKQEFRALTDVSHPNLVTLHELISRDDRLFFTMELVEGMDLLAHLRGEGAALDPTITPDELAKAGAAPAVMVRVNVPSAQPAAAPVDLDRLRAAMRQLAEGVSALHTAGKLHRDLKPSNVLVTPAGRVVILDFGLVSDRTRGARDATADGSIMGTPAYMAPEQAAGRRARPASDWYAVGVILYEALTGAWPFTGSVLQIVFRKQQEDPPPPRALAPGIPDDLNDLCVALLRRDPDERPGGEEVLRRLGSLPRAPAADVLPSQPSRFVGRAPELRESGGGAAGRAGGSLRARARPGALGDGQERARPPLHRRAGQRRGSCSRGAATSARACRTRRSTASSTA